RTLSKRPAGGAPAERSGGWNMTPRFDSLGWGDVYRRAYSAANYRLRTVAGGRWADHCRPTDIAFLMTNLCNAKCEHCDIWKNKGKDDTPTVDQYRATLSEIRR